MIFFSYLISDPTHNLIPYFGPDPDSNTLLQTCLIFSSLSRLGGKGVYMLLLSALQNCTIFNMDCCNYKHKEIASSNITRLRKREPYFRPKQLKPSLCFRRKPLKNYTLYKSWLIPTCTCCPHTCKGAPLQVVYSPSLSASPLVHQFISPLLYLSWIYHPPSINHQSLIYSSIVQFRIHHDH